MEARKTNSKSNGIKNLKKKLSYKYFEDKNNLKNIDNNTSYTSSGEDEASSLGKKNNGLNLKLKAEPQNKNINNKIGKENNINTANKNTIAPFQGLPLNKGIQATSNRNIFYPIVNNSQLINNNVLLHHPFNINLLNRNQLIANNNILLINQNLNQQLINNNNLIPRPTNFIPAIPLRSGLGLIPSNQQTFINNDIQPRLTNIPIEKRYSLENNKVINRERNVPFLNNGPKDNIKHSTNIKRVVNQMPIQQKNNNIRISNVNNANNISENNRGSSSSNQQEIYQQGNRPSLDPFINKYLNNNDPYNNNNARIISNRETIVPKTNYILNNFRISNPNVNPSNSGLNKKIIPVVKKIPENNIANIPHAFQTIEQNNQNKQLNNYIKTPINQNIVIQKKNIIPTDNYNNNNIVKQTQNNYLNSNPYNQLLNNFNQNPENNGFSENILLRDFGTLSRPGNDETGMTKTNQDSYISKTNINGINVFNIFGVLDGHGPEGHFVSEFASEFIPNFIINNPAIRGDLNPESIYNKLRHNNYQIIKQAFLVADNQLKKVTFDAKESGTTCVLVIHIGNHLVCSNVGDSRAIVAFDENNDLDLKYLRAIPLSIDYKPELPEERARILMSGGVVEQVQNDYGIGVGPYRVFAPGKDYPGLAMSRSIGDLDGKNLGIIAEPGIREFPVSKTTKFFILCSDGVWEFLDNELVKNVGRQFYLNSNANELCQELVSRSVIEWKKNDNIIDDITAISVFF